MKKIVVLVLTLLMAISLAACGGSGLGGSVSDIAKLCPQATILEGKAIWGRDIKNSQDEVSKWARELKL